MHLQFEVVSPGAQRNDEPARVNDFETGVREI